MQGDGDVLQMYEATRYIVPLREGGSLPAVLDTDSGGMFVTKFRGAGQGAKALVAEILVGAFARLAGLDVPEIALIELDECFGRTERDPEIQDILKGSRGLNVGLRYLPGAFNYDPLAFPEIDRSIAARIVWLDAFVSNVDRTARNTNMLVWENRLWLIDHGAALYFHHNWSSVDDATARAPFAAIESHVLLPIAGDLLEADRSMCEALSREHVAEIVESLPEELLMDAPAGVVPAFESVEQNRAAYIRYFEHRLEGDRPFVEQAGLAKSRLADEPQQTLSYRR